MCPPEQLQTLKEYSNLCFKYQLNGGATSVGGGISNANGEQTTTANDLTKYDCKPPEYGTVCKGGTLANGANEYQGCSGNGYFVAPAVERCTDNCPCGFNWENFEDRCGKWAEKKCKKKQKKGKCAKKKIMKRCGSTCYGDAKRYLECAKLKPKDKRGSSCAKG